MLMIFDDRAHAGRVLGERLAHFASEKNVFILALPRGGVPVGYEVAKALRAPLDVLVARKLGAPGNPEYAIGAVAPGARVISADAIAMLGLSYGDVEALAAEEAKELERREKAYREGRPPLALEGRTAVLVDDGLATGATMLAAIRSARLRRPARGVAAVPVGDPATCAAVRREADELVCAAMPEELLAVGNWYRDFAQTTDEEVRALLGAFV
jgi:putative phosphoribosyl transferase